MRLYLPNEEKPIEEPTIEQLDGVQEAAKEQERETAQ